jgi:hypothetical protein
MLPQSKATNGIIIPKIQFINWQTLWERGPEDSIPKTSKPVTRHN